MDNNQDDETLEYKELFNLFQETDEVEYLDAAIALAEEIQPKSTILERDLQNMLHVRAQHDPAQTSPTIPIDSESHPGPLPRISQLGSNHTHLPYTTISGDHEEDIISRSWTLFEQYQRTKEPHLLNEAIDLSNRAIIIHPRHPDRALRISKVCMMLVARFERFRNPHDYAGIVQAITGIQECELPESADSAGFIASTISDVLSNIDRWIFNGIVQPAQQHQGDPDTGVYIRAKADGNQVGGMEKWHILRPNALPNFEGGEHEASSKDLAMGLLFQLVFPRQPEDIDEAVTHESEMLANTPSQDPRRMHWYCVLGQMYIARYIKHGRPTDLDVARRFGEQSFLAIPPGNIATSQTLLGWANICSVVHNATNNVKYLSKAIDLIKEVSSGPSGPGVPGKWFCLKQLSNVYKRKYMKTEDKDDLDEAIAYLEEAQSLTQRPNPSGVARERQELLPLIFRSALDVNSDLLPAIKLHEQALQVAKTENPDDDTYELGEPGFHLMELLFRYFHMKSQNIDDLNRAIKLGENILRKARYLKPDSLQAGKRFISDDIAYLQIATRVAIMLTDRYNLYGEEIDLVHAEKLLGKALEEATDASPERELPLVRWRISQVHIARYKKTGDGNELKQAKFWGGIALHQCPPDHSYRYVLGENYGIVLFEELRYNEKNGSTSGGVIENVSEMVQIHLTQWYQVELHPNARILGARNAASVMLALGDAMIEDAFELLENAVHVLSLACSRTARRDDQQEKLGAEESFGLASEAATVALRAHKTPYEGLRLLEFGRVLIAGRWIDCRTDLSALRVSHPVLAEQVESLRAEIDSPQAEGRRQRDRRAAAAEFEKALTRIRELPGQEEFLLPPKPDTLMRMAVDGPIVLVNCTRYGSHAIVVKQDSIESLLLKDLGYNDMETNMTGILQSMKKTSPRAYNKSNKAIQNHLLWLWNTIVEPILTHLQFDGSTSTLRRIWWIGVGKLSLAPFHAAGDHSPGSTNNTISRVISSYISSIKALSYTRQKPISLFPFPSSPASLPNVSEKPQLLMITMPTTVGHGALAGVTKEAQEIYNALSPNHAVVTTLECPSAAQVLEKLPESNILHFACHGLSDPFNPSDSRLLLRDPDPTSKVPDALSVRSISQANTEKAQIAYLSACSTAEIRTERLADEAIHIASAFQLAGFSHVLGTLWSSNDGLCQQVATKFYKLLFEGWEGEGVEGHARVARAFHEAVKAVRDKKPKNILGWAPFIHTGA